MAASSLWAKNCNLLRALSRLSASRNSFAFSTQCSERFFKSEKLFRPLVCHKKLISTSDKNKVVGGVTADKLKPAKEESLTEKDENWISYGFSLYDRNEDEWAHHMAMFFCITLFLCWGTFYYAYYPDIGEHDWAQREAYLELERREKEGKALIDPDYVNIDNIELPSDEELGDFEIVI